jgi:hypothetical protein
MGDGGRPVSQSEISSGAEAEAQAVERTPASVSVGWKLP